MSNGNQGSIAAFGYRHTIDVPFQQIVQGVDDMLQSTDPMPRHLRWVEDNIAIIDRDDTRIALGYLAPNERDSYSYIVIAVGLVPGCSANGLSNVSHSHFTDRLVYRFREDLPFDTIMRGESPEPVDPSMMQALFELLQQAPIPDQEFGEIADSISNDENGRAAIPATGALTHTVDVINQNDINAAEMTLPKWLSARAEPSEPLRLTVHTMALSVMLYSPALGAFMYTYSMLRDVSGGNKTG